MNTRFLTVYQDLSQGKLDKLTGLWLLHGDEPLMSQWLIDAFRPLFAKHDQTPKRLSLSTAKDWYEVIVLLDSLSLFGLDNALIIDGKQTPNQETLSNLERFATACANHETNHCLIYVLPKQDKKAQNSKLFKLFLAHGVVVDCHLYDEKMRQDILKMQSARLGIGLDQESWQLLISSTEHHLLAAYQTLWRLSELYPNDSAIDVSQLQNALSEHSQYSIFHLCDVFLTGDTKKTLEILHELQTTHAPSLILWGLSKEIHILLQLMDGKSMQSLGIWQSKTKLYQQALTALRPAPHHLNALYEIDKAIKGVQTMNVWTAFERLIISLNSAYAPASHRTHG